MVLNYSVTGLHRRLPVMPTGLTLLISLLWLVSVSSVASVAGQEVQVAPDIPAAPEALPLDGRSGRELLLRNFRPRAQLRVASHPRERAKFPVVDVHTHFHYRLRDDPQAIAGFVELMDRNNIAICCSLDGRLGIQLANHQRSLGKSLHDRFVIFANIDWQGDGNDDDPASWACNQEGFVRNVVTQLEIAAEDGGISGLKIFKGLGLEVADRDRRLWAIDSPRWDPIWKACAQLGLPVIMHVADPAAFFEAVDETNERWEELSRHPDWSFHGSKYPSRQELLEARNRIVARHPQTQFIGAHVANQPEDLAEVGRWLDAYPNLSVEIASRIGELGRQPFTARDFLIQYADRVMFGTDGPWPETRIRLYWRFLETRDEYFPYSEKEFPPQGLWQIYGVHLPDSVLKKIYYQNAARLIPGVAQRLKKRHPDLELPGT